MGLPTDIGIVTVIPTEVDAVFRAFGINRDSDLRTVGTLEYWTTSIYSEANEAMIRIAISFISGNAGNVESAILTSLVVEKLCPRLMCLVGIAAGAAGKIRIGDVVLPDVVHDVTVNVRKDGATQPRMRQYTIDQRLSRELKVRPFSNEVFASSLSWTSDDLTLLRGSAVNLHLDENDIASPPELKDGSLVSGNTLLRDRAYFPDFHQTNDERCRAGEMEAAGFARACELTGCAWLTVRGISDYGDERKGDEFQSFAAVNAAVALRQLLDRNIRLKVFPRHRGVTPDFDFSDSLESSLVEEYSKTNWNFVVEIGSFLSRPLWLSGKLELRKRIGELVEDAAANGGRISDRARALIDDVGWTSMAMGQINKARKAISDGLRIAREATNWYLSAKACRHLASISRQEGDLETCGTYLTAAECFAADISNPDEKSEMITSLLVSRAKLMIALGEAKDAISGLEAAQRQFESAGDYLRAAKTYHSLGMAYLASGEEGAAVAAYERGYRLSMKLGRRDEALANASALATLFDNRDPEGALRWAYKAVEVASELADARLNEKVMTILTRNIGAHGGIGYRHMGAR